MYREVQESFYLRSNKILLILLKVNLKEPAE